MRHLLRRGALAAALLTLGGATSALVAQDQEVPQIGEARMTVFATVWLAMNDARDDFHGELGRTHEAQERDRLRARLKERLAEILAEHEMTQEEYDQITLVVSIDQPQRELFEAILARIEGGVGAESP